ncbi:unnamed protein product [Caenorhabditis nigoni]
MIRFHHSRPHDRYPCAIRVKSSHGTGETIPLASGYIVKFRDQTVYYHEAGGLCRRLNDKERRKLANQYHEIHWSLGTSSAVVGNGANDKRYQEEVFKNFWQKIEMDGNGAIFEFEMLHNYVDVFYGFFLPADFQPLVWDV